MKQEFLVLSSFDDEEMFDIEAESMEAAAMLALQHLGWYVIKGDEEDEDSPKKFHTK
jgi:hypothetical protein